MTLRGLHRGLCSICLFPATCDKTLLKWGWKAWCWFNSLRLLTPLTPPLWELGSHLRVLGPTNLVFLIQLGLAYCNGGETYYWGTKIYQLYA